MSMQRKKSRRPKMPPLQRPPFENRYGSGEQGRRWFRELEYHGPEYVRIRLAQLDAVGREAGVEPFTIPPGFAHDWLVYRDRQDRRVLANWRRVIALLALIAAVAAVIAAMPVLLHWSAR
jgi:hypothetical protein